MVRDNCSCRHGWMKWADIASKIMPIGYAILKAMLIHDLWLAPIFSVTVNKRALSVRINLCYFATNDITEGKCWVEQSRRRWSQQHSTDQEEPIPWWKRGQHAAANVEQGADDKRLPSSKFIRENAKCGGTNEFTQRHSHSYCRTPKTLVTYQTPLQRWKSMSALSAFVLLRPNISLPLAQSTRQALARNDRNYSVGLCTRSSRPVRVIEHNWRHHCNSTNLNACNSSCVCGIHRPSHCLWSDKQKITFALTSKSVTRIVCTLCAHYEIGQSDK